MRRLPCGRTCRTSCSRIWLNASTTTAAWLSSAQSSAVPRDTRQAHEAGAGAVRRHRASAGARAGRSRAQGQRRGDEVARARALSWRLRESVQATRGSRHWRDRSARLPGVPGAARRSDSPAATSREAGADRAGCRATEVAGRGQTCQGARPRRREMADRGTACVGSTRTTRERRARATQSEQDMTPTNLPVQPATPATPASTPGTVATEQTQTADFLLMLGQLVAASVQRSGASVSPTTPKLPAMVLDEAAGKDELSPEQLLAMMAVPQQVLPIDVSIDVPVEQALPSLPTVG